MIAEAARLGVIWTTTLVGMLVSSFWNSGAILSLEHLVMVIIGGAGSGIIVSRLSKLRIQVNGRLSAMEQRIAELEAEAGKQKAEHVEGS